MTRYKKGVYVRPIGLDSDIMAFDNNTGGVIYHVLKFLYELNVQKLLNELNLIFLDNLLFLIFFKN